MSLIRNLAVLSAIVLVAAALFTQKAVQEPVIDFLKQSMPWSVSVFGYVEEHVLSGSPMGVLLYLLFANIPILPSIPAEAYAIFAFMKGTNMLVILFLTAAVYMLFAAAYYIIGYFFGNRILEKMLKKKVAYNSLIDKLSGFIILLVYAIPIPLPIPSGGILVMLFGSYRSKFMRIILLVGFATLLKFLLVIALYHRYTDLLVQYLGPLNQFLKVG